MRFKNCVTMSFGERGVLSQNFCQHFPAYGYSLYISVTIKILRRVKWSISKGVTVRMKSFSTPCFSMFVMRFSTVISRKYWRNMVFMRMTQRSISRSCSILPWLLRRLNGVRPKLVHLGKWMWRISRSRESGTIYIVPSTGLVVPNRFITKLLKF